MKCIVILERRADGYRTWVPDLPGCIAAGLSIALRGPSEHTARAVAAAEGWIFGVE